MSLVQKVLNYIKHLFHSGHETSIASQSEAQMIASGWDKYAKEWHADKFLVVAGHQVKRLGDEWTSEEVKNVKTTTYGLTPEIIADFNEYIKMNLIVPYIPSDTDEGLEIGPGGGRLTAILAPFTKRLHLVEPSEAMLEQLRQRFEDATNLFYYHSDGMNLPPLSPDSLDYVIALDVFVHFEPRLVYWYLRQIMKLLRPGGIGIIHYANVLTPIGWHQFELDLESNVQHRSYFAAFGVMCPPLMRQFLEALGANVICADTRTFPRDAVAVFQKAVKS